MDIADDAILVALESELLHPRVLKAAVARAVAALTGTGRDDQRKRLTRELATIEQEIENLTGAVTGGGGDVAALVTALRSREVQRGALVEQLKQPTVTTADPQTVRAALQARLREARGLLRGDVKHARALLKQLIVGRIAMAPDDAGFYRFTGTGTLQPLLSGVMAVLPQSMASPPGFDTYGNTV